MQILRNFGDSIICNMLYVPCGATCGISGCRH